MRIVVPMAGRGSRLATHAPGTPKPFIDVAGRPMVSWALESLRGIDADEVIFVALRQDAGRYGLEALARGIVGDRARLVLLDAVTEGQLATVLAARRFIDRDDDVLVASADTYVVSDLARDIASRPAGSRGVISVARLPGDRWSFARTDASGRVVEVAEKVRVSPYASTGLYHFSSGQELVRIADAMIEAGERTRGEYYVIPVYQKIIDAGGRVDVSIATAAHDMGTPEAIMEFLQRVAV